MFLGRDIAQLVGHNECIAYLRFDVAVRVAVYPIINAAIGYKITQLYRKGSIDGAAFEFGCSA